MGGHKHITGEYADTLVKVLKCILYSIFILDGCCMKKHAWNIQNANQRRIPSHVTDSRFVYLGNNDTLFIHILAEISIGHTIEQHCKFFTVSIFLMLTVRFYIENIILNNVISTFVEKHHSFLVYLNKLQIFGIKSKQVHYCGNKRWQVKHSF